MIGKKLPEDRYTHADPHIHILTSLELSDIAVELFWTSAFCASATSMLQFRAYNYSKSLQTICVSTVSIPMHNFGNKITFWLESLAKNKSRKINGDLEFYTAQAVVHVHQKNGTN